MSPPIGALPDRTKELSVLTKFYVTKKKRYKILKIITPTSFNAQIPHIPASPLFVYITLLLP